MQLNREKGAPSLYAQIISILKEMIESGKYPKNSFLPTEKQLEQMFGVSRVTVRQAVNQLANDGYIETAQGIGTKIIFDKINENLKGVKSFSEEMAQHGMKMETTYCTIRRVKLDEFVSAHFDKSKVTEGSELIRVRGVNDSPLVYSITYINGIYALPIIPFKYYDSLYDVLKNEYSIDIVSGEETFEAILSDEEISARLQISEKSPVFKRVRKTYDQHGNNLEYTTCYYVGSRYKYSITI